MKRMLLAAIELLEAVLALMAMTIAGVASVCAFLVLVPFTLIIDRYVATSPRPSGSSDRRLP